jgi:acyl-CoA thioesterase-1
MKMKRGWLVAWIAGGLALLTPLEASASDGPVKPITIVALGDSLTAGFGLPPAAAFPVQLEAALKARGHDVIVINAGVSGDTTSAGLERLEWAVPDGTDAAIVELGANDALRGLPPEVAKSNLDRIITRLKAKGLSVLIAGMKAPRNWGEAYATQFDALFQDLSTKHETLYYPFFLDGVALQSNLNLGDGIHPNAAGVAAIVERILPTVEALVNGIKSRRQGARKG